MAVDARLGIAPIAWSNDDLPELGGDTSLETCLSEARLAGFSGVESGGKFPMTAKAPPLEYARIGHAALSRAPTDAGFEIREGRS